MLAEYATLLGFYLIVYLARTGYDSQQYDGAEDPNRPENLWQPVPGDHGAHGAFDARARNWSPQLWTSEHRAWIAAAVVVLGISGLLAFLKKKQSHPRDKRSSKLTDVLHEIW